jgi:uncharacterized membrane protein (DUF106 family)
MNKLNEYQKKVHNVEYNIKVMQSSVSYISISVVISFSTLWLISEFVHFPKTGVVVLFSVGLDANYHSQYT